MTLPTALMLCVPLLGESPRHIDPGKGGVLPAIIVGDRVYWKGKSPGDGALRLHSMSLAQPTSIEDHDLWRMELPNQPIAWHIHDEKLWALSWWWSYPRFTAYTVARAALPLPKRTVTGLMHIACQPLGMVDVDRSTGLPVPARHFDYVPIAHNRGKLFILEENHTLTVWEYSPGDADPDWPKGIDPARRKAAIKKLLGGAEGRVHGPWDWRKAAEFGANFFEPFQVYLREDDPVLVTASGKLYAVDPGSGDHGKRTMKQKGTGPIVMVIDDHRKGKVLAFTKKSCFSLDEPARTRPIKLPEIKDPEARGETAQVLLRAVEFLDRK